MATVAPLDLIFIYEERDSVGPIIVLDTEWVVQNMLINKKDLLERILENQALIKTLDELIRERRFSVAKAYDQISILLRQKADVLAILVRENEALTKTDQEVAERNASSETYLYQDYLHQ